MNSRECTDVYVCICVQKNSMETKQRQHAGLIVVVIAGVPASGKSTLAATIAKGLSARERRRVQVRDLDDFTQLELARHRKGEHKSWADMQSVIYVSLLKVVDSMPTAHGVLILAGVPVLYRQLPDGTFDHESDFDLFGQGLSAALGEKRRLSVCRLFLDTPADALAERWTARGQSAERLQVSLKLAQRTQKVHSYVAATDTECVQIVSKLIRE